MTSHLWNGNPRETKSSRIYPELPFTTRSFLSQSYLPFSSALFLNGDERVDERADGRALPSAGTAVGLTTESYWTTRRCVVIVPISNLSLVSEYLSKLILWKQFFFHLQNAESHLLRFIFIQVNISMYMYIPVLHFLRQRSIFIFKSYTRWIFCLNKCRLNVIGHRVNNQC